MRSIIGEPIAWYKDYTNPYITYSYGVKEQGQPVPALFCSEQLAWNAFMQTLVDLVISNQYKNIVWRSFPSIREETYEIMGEQRKRYWVVARFTFSDKDS